MKSEYGPTLGQLLAPRWRGASRRTRLALILAGVLVLAVLAGIALTLENSSYSRGGPVPFSFQYRGLYRAPADRGAFVKVDARNSAGQLRYSFEVYPLRLPAYDDGLWGELPLYATGYIATLAASVPHFELTGEGRTKLTGTELGYEVLYTAVLEGREVYGRNVMLLPERPGVREGVVAVMLTAKGASSQIKGPSEVATTGVLLRPLKSLTFG